MKIFIDERKDTITKTLGLDDTFAQQAGEQLSQIIDELKSETEGETQEFDLLELIDRYQKKFEFSNLQEVVFITYSYTMAFNTLKRLHVLNQGL